MIIELGYLLVCFFSLYMEDNILVYELSVCGKIMGYTAFKLLENEPVNESNILEL